jgi:hypothetical protein
MTHGVVVYLWGMYAEQVPSRHWHLFHTPLGVLLLVQMGWFTQRTITVLLTSHRLETA